MKKLVYENVGSVVINDNPAEVFNFAANSLDSYFSDASDDMFCDDPYKVAFAFVDHYAGFHIEEC